MSMLFVDVTKCRAKSCEQEENSWVLGSEVWGFRAWSLQRIQCKPNRFQSLAGVDGHEAKCRFKVSFCHEGPRTQRAEYVNGVIYTNILEGIGILKDIIVNTVTLGVGEVVNVRQSVECFLGTTSIG